MRAALQVILDQSLPQLPTQIKQRVLVDLRTDVKRDLLTTQDLARILTLSLPEHRKKEELIEQIVRQVYQQKDKSRLEAYVRTVLQEPREVDQVVRELQMHVVANPSCDLLDPSEVAPLLKRALSSTSKASKNIEGVLQKLRARRTCGASLPLLQQAFDAFKKHVGEDLNMSAALATLFDLVREVNSLCDAGMISSMEAEDTLDFLRTVDRVLGVLFVPAEDEGLSLELMEALRAREQARASRDWKTADHYRDLLLAKGYLIEDTPYGARLKRKMP
jgi:AcrR family transcriptional regulator